MVDINHTSSLPSMTHTNTYSDAELERLLKESKDKSLYELIQIQMLIAEKYSEASEAYKHENSHIKLEIKRYYFKILIEFFIELSRFIRGKSPKATRSHLKSKKRDLKKSFEEQQGGFDNQMSAIKVAMDMIKELADEVTAKENQLAVLQETIASVDSKSQLPGMAQIRENIDEHVSERDALEDDITQSYQEMEGILNALADFLHMDGLKRDLVTQKIAHQQTVEKLKDACMTLNNELATQLGDFLTYQTPNSLEIFRDALGKNHDYHGNRVLTDMIWSAATLYPELTAGLDRVAGLSSYLAAKFKKLVELQKNIEERDAVSLQNETEKDNKQLNELLGQRDLLLNDIHQLSQSHQDLIEGADLVASCQEIDKIMNANLKSLIAECSQLSHPIVAPLQRYLTHQTSASLDALKTALKEQDDYQDSKHLVAIIWDAGEIFPEMVEGLSRAETLSSILDTQDTIHDEIFKQYDNKAISLESDMQKSLEDKTEIQEAIAGCNEAAALWNQDLNDIYKEREKERRQAHPDVPMIRSLTQESTQIVSKLEANARKKEKYEAKLSELSARLDNLRERQAELAHIKQGIPAKYNAEDLIALQVKCNASNVRKNPVITVLSQFLDYPTPSLLGKLKTALYENPSYKSQVKIKQLIAEAAQFFPEINDHSSHAFFKQKDVSDDAHQLKSGGVQPKKG